MGKEADKTNQALIELNNDKEELKQAFNKFRDKYEGEIHGFIINNVGGMWIFADVVMSSKTLDRISEYK